MLGAASHHKQKINQTFARREKKGKKSQCYKAFGKRGIAICRGLLSLTCGEYPLRSGYFLYCDSGTLQATLKHKGRAK